ncbi:MAG: hypothetical protein R3F24_14395 [Gammaproteobacteria bacterium]
MLLVAVIMTWESLPETLTMVPDASTPPAGQYPYQSIGTLHDLNVAFANRNGRLYGIQDQYVFISEDGGRTFVRRGKLPPARDDWTTIIKDRIARLKLTRWIRRNRGPENLVVLDSGTILVFWDRIYRSADDGASFEVVYDRPQHGILAPFGNNEGVAAGPGTVYFGEYSALPRPHAIRLLEGSNDGRDWRVVHTFPSGDIFHVHSIAYDRFRNRYWVCTGDNDSEDRILYTEDGFKTLQLLGGGSQDWRCVSLMITEKALVWGSDNNQTAASINRWNFATQTLEKVLEVGKPTYSSTVLSSGLLALSTVYEPTSPYTQQFHPEPTTDLWVSIDGTCWNRILSLPYRQETDRDGHMTRASLSFPAGFPTDDLYFTPQNTTLFDFETRILKLSPDKLPPCPELQAADAAKAGSAQSVGQ